MMQLRNQVIGNIKDTGKYCSVMLNQTEVEHGQSTFFCFVCNFLGISAREKVRLSHSGINWKMLRFFFSQKSQLWKEFFNTNFGDTSSDWQWNCTLWNIWLRMLAWKPQIHALPWSNCGLSGGWLDYLTEISQYKIPFCIAVISPLAQRDRHTANICLLNSLNLVPGLGLSSGVLLASGIHSRNEPEGSLTAQQSTWPVLADSPQADGSPQGAVVISCLRTLCEVPYLFHSWWRQGLFSALDPLVCVLKVKRSTFNWSFYEQVLARKSNLLEKKDLDNFTPMFHQKTLQYFVTSCWNRRKIVKPY